MEDDLKTASPASSPLNKNRFCKVNNTSCRHHSLQKQKVSVYLSRSVEKKSLSMHDLKNNWTPKSCCVLLWLVLQPYELYVIPWCLYFVHATEMYNTTQCKLRKSTSTATQKHCISLLTVYIWGCKSYTVFFFPQQKNPFIYTITCWKVARVSNTWALNRTVS